jgi:hypothetical protein
MHLPYVIYIVFYHVDFYSGPKYIYFCLINDHFLLRIHADESTVKSQDKELQFFYAVHLEWLLLIQKLVQYQLNICYLGKLSSLCRLS